MKAKKPMTQAEFRRRGGCYCPVCGGTDIVGKDVEVVDFLAVQECSCLNCKSRWCTTYRVQGYDIYYSPT